LKDQATEPWQATFNPLHGCTPISEGCRYCYGRRVAYRLKARGVPGYELGFSGVALRPDLIGKPITRRRRTRYFVSSMGDLFHKDVPDGFVEAVASTTLWAPRHDYFITTKRANRLGLLSGVGSNLWVGVSVETRDYLYRVEQMRKYCEAPIKAIWFAPLIGPIGDFSLEGISWVVVAGESGKGGRDCNPDWVREIKDQCVAKGTPFFFKQWGNGTRAPGILDGVAWRQLPKVSRIPMDFPSGEAMATIYKDIEFRYTVIE